MVVDEHELTLSAQVGIVTFPTCDEVQSLSDLMSNANLALSRAKGPGSKGGHYYRSYMRSAANMQQRLAQDLHGALAKGELRLLLQPLYQLATGKIVGCEALLRWQHPEFGLLVPSRFLSIAAEMGIMPNINAWVLATAGQHIQALETAGHNSQYIAVNIPAAEFTSLSFADNVIHMLTEHVVSPQQLMLEVTEHELIDDLPAAAAAMQSLRDAGTRIAIDDFGTGYASLRYLSQLPIDKLKIDRSFIDDIATNKEHLTIVRSIIDMANKLGVSVLAEGVETQEQHKALVALGCEHAQGFYYNGLVSLTHFLDLLALENKK